MLKVGDFSKLANVTVKTLRHYDRLGLLKPVWIDRYSGYRYYNLDQLPRLNRILALKDMGFSLEQVRQMLSTALSSDALQRIFNQKQQELEQRLQDEQSRLGRVAERLRQIEQEGRLPEAEITVKSASAQHILSLRGVIPSEQELAQRTSQMRAQVHSWAAQAGLRSRNQWMLLYHQGEYRPHNLDVEVALLVDEPGKGQADGLQPGLQPGLRLRRLPAVPRMACTLYAEGQRPLYAAYALLYAWAESQHYYANGPARQLLLEDPAPASLEPLFTEVQLPIATEQELKQELIATPYRKDDEMEPKIVNLPAFKVAGMRYYGKNENQEIAQMWGEFNKRSHEIKHVPAQYDAYGVCITVPDAPNGEFEYIASFPVESAEDIPQGMVVRDVPAGKYAVFAHVGSMEKLRDTYHYIYQVWLPQSGYKPAGGLDFELYTDEFKDFAPDSRFYIYVMVE